MILYQLFMALALLPVLVHQALRGGKAAVAQRLGFGPDLPPGPSLWFHAASVGEVTSARWVIEAVLAARPGVQVLVTTNTATGRDRVQAWGLAGVHCALAPFDSAGAAGRLLDRIQPQALISVENEMWPARLQAADNRGVPVLVIGARMSARSAKRWEVLGGLIRGALARVDWLSAQDEVSLDRLLVLGLPEQAAGPVVALKAQGRMQDVALPFPPPATRARTLLAASTHEGEEALILDAFLSSDRFDHLILAPRHPRRGDEIAAMLQAKGVAFARRSKGQTPDPKTPVYLADTIGEMDAWYAMAGVTVIGGSFAAKGGHTPWEPARAGSAILHGPSVHNFVQPFTALDRAGGAIAVADGAALGLALAQLDPDSQSQMAKIASEVLAPAGTGAEVVNAVLRRIKG